MSIEKGNKKEKNQNIQVFVRLRPINNRERELKSMGVVEVAGSKDVIVKMVPLESKLTKKFSFDRAFGPNSKQVEVYHEVVSPLIEEVLSGYNCTVFAYGQTGTGKTHTMVGESSSNGDVPWQNDPMAGIIPRALSQLFDELRITNSEFTVRVSYLELYNEELFDLLSSSEDNSKLRIYEDVTRKGSNIVNGLEEVTVYNKNEVYKIMAKGQEKRKIASTLMNAQSSRSHTVFTIVVHMKENSSEGEELMKIGKLNLVDLAGSENISKAGSDNPARKERARECVNINQSLLTLGRVITALVERHPHIPYRESKLTRLLQESLGGRTKTSIIATISPGHKDVEETLSTLDYAYRARCIQNKPEVNQRITKHAVLKEFSEEIDRLKRDLLAARERNGVYISNDSYTDMTLKLDEQTKEIQEQILYIKAMKEEKDKIEALFNEMEENLKMKEKQLQRTNAALDNAKDVIQVTKKDLANSQMECDEQKELVSKRQATEVVLSEQAHKLLRVADATTTDVHCLHNTVEKKKALEVTNLEKVKEFGEKSHSHRAQMKEQLDAFKKEQSDQLKTLQEVLDQQIKVCRNNQNDGKDLLINLLGKITEAVTRSSTSKEEYVTDFTAYSDDKLKAMKETNEKHKRVMEDNMGEILGVLQQVQNDRDKQLNSALQMLTFVQQWKDVFSVKVQNMHKMQEELWQQCTSQLTSMATEFEQQHSATLNDMNRVAKERSSHQEDMFSRLKQLKRALEELEEKSLSMSTRISTEEEDCRRAFEARGEAFSTILKDGKTNLDTASGNMKAATQEVETSHEGFLKDVVVINQEHVDRIRSVAKTEGKLGDLLTALPTQYQDICTQQNAGVEEGYQQTLHKVTQVLNDQQSRHANALQECHTDGAGVVVPMDATLKELDKCWQSSRGKIEDVQKNLDGYTHNMNDSLSVTHTIENRLLREEYKLYSPTGKTPVRREFSYPRELAATSPHERILRRFRNLRDGVQSPQNHSVINLDQTTEDLIVPAIDVTNQSSDAVCISSPEHESTNISASDVNNSKTASSEQRTKAFLEPTRLPPRATPKHTPRTSPLTKSTSDSDIYALTHAESDSKENLNNTTDRKESKSRLRPPSQKKVLANRNY